MAQQVWRKQAARSYRASHLPWPDELRRKLKIDAFQFLNACELGMGHIFSQPFVLNLFGNKVGIHVGQTRISNWSFSDGSERVETQVRECTCRVRLNDFVLDQKDKKR